VLIRCIGHLFFPLGSLCVWRLMKMWESYWSTWYKHTSDVTTS
jgi:hypothetical protein